MAKNLSLDVLVAKEVMGWDLSSNGTCFCIDGEIIRDVSDWHPSSDMNDAWSVIEKLLRDGWELDEGIMKMDRLEHGGFVIELNSSLLNPGSSDGPYVEAKTCQLAICRVARIAKRMEAKNGSN